MPGKNQAYRGADEVTIDQASSEERALIDAGYKPRHGDSDLRRTVLHVSQALDDSMALVKRKQIETMKALSAQVVTALRRHAGPSVSAALDKPGCDKDALYFFWKFFSFVATTIRACPATAPSIADIARAVTGAADPAAGHASSSKAFVKALALAVSTFEDGLPKAEAAVAQLAKAGDEAADAVYATAEAQAKRLVLAIQEVTARLATMPDNLDQEQDKRVFEILNTLGKGSLKLRFIIEACNGRRHTESEGEIRKAHDLQRGCLDAFHKAESDLVSRASFSRDLALSRDICMQTDEQLKDCVHGGHFPGLITGWLPFALAIQKLSKAHYTEYAIDKDNEHKIKFDARLSLELLAPLQEKIASLVKALPSDFKDALGFITPDAILSEYHSINRYASFASLFSGFMNGFDPRIINLANVQISPDWTITAEVPTNSIYHELYENVGLAVAGEGTGSRIEIDDPAVFQGDIGLERHDLRIIDFKYRGHQRPVGVRILPATAVRGEVLQYTWSLQQLYEYNLRYVLAELSASAEEHPMVLSLLPGVQLGMAGEDQVKARITQFVQEADAGKLPLALVNVYATINHFECQAPLLKLLASLEDMGFFNSPDNFYAVISELAKNYHLRYSRGSSSGKLQMWNFAAYLVRAGKTVQLLQQSKHFLLLQGDAQRKQRNLLRLLRWMFFTGVDVDLTKIVTQAQFDKFYELSIQVGIHLYADSHSGASQGQGGDSNSDAIKILQRFDLENYGPLGLELEGDVFFGQPEVDSLIALSEGDAPAAAIQEHLSPRDTEASIWYRDKDAQRMLVELIYWLQQPDIKKHFELLDDAFQYRHQLLMFKRLGILDEGAVIRIKAELGFRALFERLIPEQAHLAAALAEMKLSLKQNLSVITALKRGIFAGMPESVSRNLLHLLAVRKKIPERPETIRFDDTISFIKSFDENTRQLLGAWSPTVLTPLYAALLAHKRTHKVNQQVAEFHRLLSPHFLNSDADEQLQLALVRFVTESILRPHFKAEYDETEEGAEQRQQSSERLTALEKTLRDASSVWENGRYPRSEVELELFRQLIRQDITPQYTYLAANTSRVDMLVTAKAAGANMAVLADLDCYIFERHNPETWGRELVAIDNLAQAFRRAQKLGIPEATVRAQTRTIVGKAATTTRDAFSHLIGQIKSQVNATAAWNHTFSVEARKVRAESTASVAVAEVRRPQAPVHQAMVQRDVVAKVADIIETEKRLYGSGVQTSTAVQCQLQYSQPEILDLAHEDVVSSSTIGKLNGIHPDKRAMLADTARLLYLNFTEQGQSYRQAKQFADYVLQFMPVQQVSIQRRERERQTIYGNRGHVKLISTSNPRTHLWCNRGGDRALASIGLGEGDVPYLNLHRLPDGVTCLKKNNSRDLFLKLIDGARQKLERRHPFEALPNLVTAVAQGHTADATQTNMQSFLRLIAQGSDKPQRYAALWRNYGEKFAPFQALAEYLQSEKAAEPWFAAAKLTHTPGEPVGRFVQRRVDAYTDGEFQLLMRFMGHIGFSRGALDKIISSYDYFLSSFYDSLSKSGLAAERDELLSILAAPDTWKLPIEGCGPEVLIDRMHYILKRTPAGRLKDQIQHLRSMDLGINGAYRDKFDAEAEDGCVVTAAASYSGLHSEQLVAPFRRYEYEEASDVEKSDADDEAYYRLVQRLTFCDEKLVSEYAEARRICMADESQSSNLPEVNGDAASAFSLLPSTIRKSTIVPSRNIEYRNPNALSFYELQNAWKEKKLQTVFFGCLQTPGDFLRLLQLSEVMPYAVYQFLEQRLAATEDWRYQRFDGTAQVELLGDSSLVNVQGNLPHPDFLVEAQRTKLFLVAVLLLRVKQFGSLDQERAALQCLLMKRSGEAEQFLKWLAVAYAVYKSPDLAFESTNDAVAFLDMADSAPTYNDELILSEWQRAQGRDGYDYSAQERLMLAHLRGNHPRLADTYTSKKLVGYTRASGASGISKHDGFLILHCYYTALFSDFPESEMLTQYIAGLAFSINYEKIHHERKEIRRFADVELTQYRKVFQSLTESNPENRHYAALCSDCDYPEKVSFIDGLVRYCDANASPFELYSLIGYSHHKSQLLFIANQCAANHVRLGMAKLLVEQARGALYTQSSRLVLAYAESCIDFYKKHPSSPLLPILFGEGSLSWGAGSRYFPVIQYEFHPHDMAKFFINNGRAYRALDLDEACTIAKFVGQGNERRAKLFYLASRLRFVDLDNIHLHEITPVLTKAEKHPRVFSKLIELAEGSVVRFDLLEQALNHDNEAAMLAGLDKLADDPRGDRISRAAAPIDELLIERLLNEHMTTSKANRASLRAGLRSLLLSRHAYRLYDGKSTSELTLAELKRCIQKIHHDTSLSFQQKALLVIPLLDEAMFYTRGERLHEAQLLVLLNAAQQDNAAVFDNISTGEGKGHTDMCKAAMLWACSTPDKSSVVFATYTPTDAARDYEKFKGFFDTLGVKTSQGVIDAGSDSTAYVQGGVNFTTPDQFGMWWLKARPESALAANVVINEADNVLVEQQRNRIQVVAVGAEENTPEWLLEAMIDFADGYLRLKVHPLPDLQQAASDMTLVEVRERIQNWITEGYQGEAREHMLTTLAAAKDHHLEAWLYPAITTSPWLDGVEYGIKEQHESSDDGKPKVAQYALPFIDGRLPPNKNTRFADRMQVMLDRRVNRSLAKKHSTQRVATSPPTSAKAMATGAAVMARLCQAPGYQACLSSGSIGDPDDRALYELLFARKKCVFSDFARQIPDVTRGKGMDDVSTSERPLAASLIDPAAPIESNREHVRAIFFAIAKSNEATPQRPVMVMFSDYRKLNYFYNILQRVADDGYYWHKADPIPGIESWRAEQMLNHMQPATPDADKEQAFVEKAGTAGMISLVTPALSRNTDIAQKVHGLDLVLTDPSAMNWRQYLQVIGRIGRQGADGVLRKAYARGHDKPSSGKHLQELIDQYVLNNTLTNICLSKAWQDFSEAKLEQGDLFLRDLIKKYFSLDLSDPDSQGEFSAYVVSFLKGQGFDEVFYTETAVKLEQDIRTWLDWDLKQKEKRLRVDEALEAAQDVDDAPQQAQTDATIDALAGVASDCLAEKDVSLDDATGLVESCCRAENLPERRKIWQEFYAAHKSVHSPDARQTLLTAVAKVLGGYFSDENRQGGLTKEMDAALELLMLSGVESRNILTVLHLPDSETYTVSARMALSILRYHHLRQLGAQDQRQDLLQPALDPNGMRYLQLQASAADSDVNKHSDQVKKALRLVTAVADGDYLGVQKQAVKHTGILSYLSWFVGTTGRDTFKVNVLAEQMKSAIEQYQLKNNPTPSGDGSAASTGVKVPLSTDEINYLTRKAAEASEILDDRDPKVSKVLKLIAALNGGHYDHVHSVAEEYTGRFRWFYSLVGRDSRLGTDGYTAFNARLGTEHSVEKIKVAHERMAQQANAQRDSRATSDQRQPTVGVREADQPRNLEPPVRALMLHHGADLVSPRAVHSADEKRDDLGPSHDGEAALTPTNNDSSRRRRSD